MKVKNEVMMTYLAFKFRHIAQVEIPLRIDSGFLSILTKSDWFTYLFKT